MVLRFFCFLFFQIIRSILMHGRAADIPSKYLSTTGYHVGFGRVVGEGAIETLRKLDQLYHIKGKPMNPVTVVDCGLCE